MQNDANWREAALFAVGRRRFGVEGGRTAAAAATTNEDDPAALRIRPFGPSLQMMTQTTKTKEGGERAQATTRFP